MQKIYKNMNTALAFQYTSKYMSTLGGMTMASDGDRLIGLWFEGQQHFASTINADKAEKNDLLPVFAHTRLWLDEYFSGKAPSFTPPIRLLGTDFQQMVWQMLLQIPYGTTSTYRHIAHQAASQRGIATMSAQAVGGAVGRNPISIIVPCHRVIGTDGTLTGYAGGIDRKEKLLRMEAKHSPLTPFNHL